MSERINKLYRPSEMIDVQHKLKEVCDATFPQEVPFSFINHILVELHKAGYRIVKI